MAAPLQPPLAQKQVCFHCGSDCPPVPVHSGEHNFCCDGCATVYGLLSELKLNEYYNLNSHPGAQARDQQWKGTFDFLDEESTLEKMADFRNEKITKVTFSVPAIHCSSCIWLLEQLFRLKNGILKSEVNFLRKEVYITYNHHEVKLSQVAELLSSLGYKPHLTMERLERKAPPSGNRQLYIRLGIAAFCFGNIMLLSFPEYLGIEEKLYARFFGYLNFVLAIPVLLFSCRDYFRSAWNGLKNRQINMDVPLALGMIVLFGRSTWEVFTHSGAGYFDSFAGLLFFLLLGKVFQQRTWDALSFERDYKSYFPLSVTVRVGREEKIIPISQLAPGMVLIARNGELIPADGTLISGTGRIDYSFVTGESDPVKVESGSKVFAGGKQVGAQIEVLITREVSQSYLARLWNNEAFSKHRESEVTQLATRVGRNFTWRLLIIAAGAAAFWLWKQPERTAEIVTSILIVACPCALALSTPFTLGNVLRIMGRNGFYLKGPAAIEQLAEANAIVFDKTGTLTQAGDSSANWQGTPLNENELHLLASLLKQSHHPLSKRLLAHLPQHEHSAVPDFEEVPGQGIRGTVNGKRVAAGRRTFVEQTMLATFGVPEGELSGDGAEVWVGVDSKVAGKFLLSDRFRDNVSEMLPSLGAEYKLSVISGDNDREHGTLVAMLPPGSALRFRQSPEDKLHFIQQLQQEGAVVLMIGDGLNDAGALRQSDAGISVSEDSGTFTPGSDGILEARKLAGLGKYLRFARASMKIIRGSFILSLIYNTVGIGFAISGHLSPLVAAVLMPLSSITVILFTTLSSAIVARRLSL